MSFFWKLWATFMGLGYFPLAPGTLASFAVLLGYWFILYRLPWPAYSVFVFALFLLGARASSAYAEELGLHDPGRIVIDEACGQLLALFLVPREWIPLALGFVLFRVFDVLKPFSIRKLENLPGGWGIMADDVGAGIAAGLFVHLFLLLRRVLEVP
jgi:phosphatidylglycerophosphatase A